MTAPFLLLLALQATSPAAGDDIVVTARMQRAREVVGRQVDAVLPPLRFDQPLARFTAPVCPGVTGLSRASAQAVVDRIGVVADETGLRVGAPGCDPNLVVIVTADGPGTVRRLIDRRPGNVRAQSLADVRRLIAEPGAARGWAEIETRSRDGDRADNDPGGPPTLSVQTASRSALAIRRDIVSAVVVIDAAAVAGRDIGQMADYAAFRALTDARPGKGIGDETIMSAFLPGGDAAAPTSLTPLDRAVLRGIYAGQGNVAWGIRRGDIVRAIVAGDTAGADRPAAGRGDTGD
ncbi:hypothetical protein ASG29_08630 [Sphingomonas sp. Leaf412]|uniref:hypothetical protein n=1 Tax=Sphingomonas sp. Leaf412 TaxID=1736370 RepID=UPI0006F6EA96|nr:hypothetical protein [Sphingomonas sp. Leaf412]KQT31930.1 hypothetical protein ASG29_08630 [Sphingomonas sp. Leaf412]